MTEKDKNREELDKRQKELEKTVIKVVNYLKTADLPDSHEDDDKIRKCAAGVISEMITDKVTMGEAQFVIQRTAGIFSRIFAAITQTVDEGCNDRLADLFGVEHAGKILIEKIVKK